MLSFDEILSNCQPPIRIDEVSKPQQYRRPEVAIVTESTNVICGAHGAYGDGVTTYHTDRG